MRRTIVLLAWWFLAWGLNENHYGLINRVGPYDTQADCEAYRQSTKEQPKWDGGPAYARNHVSPSCWFTKEQVIEQPKEAPRAR